MSEVDEAPDYRTGILLPAQAALPAQSRILHVRILRAFLAHGAPPGPARLAAWASDLALDLPEAMSLLAAGDLVHTDPERGEVVIAYPFSGTPTDYRVELPGAPPAYAMCAIDALGVPLMTGRDGLIRSRDPITGERIEIRRRGTSWRWQPATTVVLSAAYDADGPSACRVCPLVTFHALFKSAVDFQRRAGVLGRVLEQHESIRAAERIFIGLLDESPGPTGAS